MSCSVGRGVCSAACCLPGICFRRRSLAALHPRSLHIRNSLAETASEITSWLSRQSAALSSACSRTRITFAESSDISMLRITLEGPAGAQKLFSDEYKNSGCKCLGDGERCHAKPECCHGNCNWKSLCSQV